MPKANALTNTVKVPASQLVHAADVGNFAIKTLTSTQKKPLRIRSIYAPVGEGSTLKRASSESPIIRYDGQTVHFGQQAYKYDLTNAVVTGDKNSADVYIPALLSTIRESGTYQLRVSIPNVRTQLPALQGKTFKYELDTGTGFTEYTVKFSKLEVVLEGVAAWKYAHSKGLVPDKGYTLMVDVGGKTFNAIVIDAEGEIVGEPISFDGQGGIGLAALIANSPTLKAAIGDEANLALVQDGLANGTNQYGVHDVNWTPMLDGLTQRWFTANFQSVRTRVTPHAPLIRTFIFTGGGVHHFEKYVTGKPGMHVLPEPDYGNLHGLML